MNAGLCPDCSTKLNYGHQRKEVKRAKRHSTSSSKTDKYSHSRKKRSKHGSKSRGSPEPSSSKSGSKNEKEEERERSKSPENIWKEPLAVPEMKSREEEFEEYLDDLFV